MLKRRFASKGFVSMGTDSRHLSRIIFFINSVLRGIGQVFLQNNSYSGIVFLVGIFWSSQPCGSAALLGAVFGTLTALLFKADRKLIEDGIYGFNGALVGIALIYFLEPNSFSWGYLILGAIFSTILMSFLSEIMKVWNLSAYTMPFVLTTYIFILACSKLGALQTTDVLPMAGLPEKIGIEGVVTVSSLVKGTLHGISQVFFQENGLTGALFLVGILINSKRSFALALGASLLGAFLAWQFGAQEVAIRGGAFGFNAVLVAIALGSYFEKLNLMRLVYILLAVTTTTVFFAGISGVLLPLGMPALTAPFVCITWIFIQGSRGLSLS